MELIIEEKKEEKLSYEDILKKMNLKVVDGKLSEYEPSKKNSYFYPSNKQLKFEEPKKIITKQEYVNYLVQKINQKKRISQIKSKRMIFNQSNIHFYNQYEPNTFFNLKIK
jgi:hypothetical protein